MIASLFTSFIATKLGRLLPPWLWEIVIIALLVIASALAHHVAVVHHDNGVRATQKAADQADETKRYTKLLAALTAKNAQLATISAQLRKANDEANTRIAADAGDLRLRGPGKAACPRLSGPAATPGQSQPSSGAGGSAATPLPSGNLAAVPWDWLVGTGEQADLNRQEVLNWRDWYAQLVKAWPKSK